MEPDICLDAFRHFEEKMADHQKEIDEFGNSDDFWLFGYGCDYLW